VHFEKERGVSEITVQRGIAHVFARPTSDTQRLEILKLLAESTVPVFLVKLHPKDVISFAVREENVESCANCLDDISIPYSMTRDLAVLTTLAGAMRDLSGVMAKIYETIVRANVKICQTGDAYNAVLCLVPGADAERAAVALRETFALTEAGSAGGSTK